LDSQSQKERRRDTQNRNRPLNQESMNDDSSLLNKHRFGRSPAKQEPKGRRWDQREDNGLSSQKNGNSGGKKTTTRRGYCCCSVNRCLLSFLVVLMLFYQYYEARGSLGSSTVKKLRFFETSNEAAPSPKRVRPITTTTKLKQIDNYRSGNGLLLNLHPTHHGGTSFCGIIGRTGGPIASKKYPEIAPDFACWYDRQKILDIDYSPHNATQFLFTTPVRHQDMDTYIKGMRSKFHMTSWEYDGVDEMQRNISESNWEHPELVSVVITRDPISRLLAGGQSISKWYPGYNKGNLSHAGWWDYATNPNRQQTDNFFLRILEGTRRKDGPIGKHKQYRRKLSEAKEKYEKEKAKRTRPRRKGRNEGIYEKPSSYMYTDDNLPSLSALRGDFDIDESHYEKAVAIMNRFTVVLDIACLDDGFDALSKLLGLDISVVTEKRELVNEKRKRKGKTAHEKLSSAERIGYDDVYKYLVEKNEFDIKLYEYSKTISLVDCNS